MIIGGQEEKFGRLHSNEDSDSEDDLGRAFPQRRTAHSLVTTFRRAKEPIRLEIVASSENYLKVELS